MSGSSTPMPRPPPSGSCRGSRPHPPAAASTPAPPPHWTTRSPRRPGSPAATRPRHTATDIRIAKVLTLAGATTVAEARVPRTGAPTTALDVKLTGAALGGIPAEITPDGIRISDKAAASPVTIAQFNAALAQLQEKGITVLAAPLI